MPRYTIRRTYETLEDAKRDVAQSFPLGKNFAFRPDRVRRNEAHKLAFKISFTQPKRKK
jgi:hypothetical protein